MYTKEFLSRKHLISSLPRGNKIVPILIKTRKPSSGRLVKRRNIRILHQRLNYITFRRSPTTAYSTISTHFLKSLSHSLFPTLLPNLEWHPIFPNESTPHRSFEKV